MVGKYCLVVRLQGLTTENELLIWDDALIMIPED
jgi:hypothetical protein